MIRILTAMAFLVRKTSAIEFESLELLTSSVAIQVVKNRDLRKKQLNCLREVCKTIQVKKCVELFSSVSLQIDFGVIRSEIDANQIHLVKVVLMKLFYKSDNCNDAVVRKALNFIELFLEKGLAQTKKAMYKCLQAINILSQIFDENKFEGNLSVRLAVLLDKIEEDYLPKLIEEPCGTLVLLEKNYAQKLRLEAC